MPAEASKEPEIKYPHPKILLMDLQEGVEDTLANKGYDVASGSFGTPYKVPKSDSMMPIIRNGNFPDDFNEREIVIIDLNPKPPLEKPVGEKETIVSELDWWAKCNRGV